MQRLLIVAALTVFIASPGHAQSFAGGFGTGNVLPYPWGSSPDTQGTGNGWRYLGSSAYAQALPTDKAAAIRHSARRHVHKASK
jgi:hypothetical protein